MPKCAFLWCLLAAPVGFASAETVYVTDSLRLGLHQAADTNDPPFDHVLSGTAVEVLERTTSHARVRLEDGREGWVEAAYLGDAKPAAARVLELEAELERTVAAASTAQAAADQELARLRAAVNAQTGSSESVEETIERLQIEHQAQLEQLEAYRYSLPLGWVVAALVVALVAGFFAGLWWLDGLIRRRHGGFRIY